MRCSLALSRALPSDRSWVTTRHLYFHSPRSAEPHAPHDGLDELISRLSKFRPGASGPGDIMLGLPCRRDAQVKGGTRQHGDIRIQTGAGGRYVTTRQLLQVRRSSRHIKKNVVSMSDPDFFSSGLRFVLLAHPAGVSPCWPGAGRLRGRRRREAKRMQVSAIDLYVGEARSLEVCVENSLRLPPRW